MSPKQLGLHHMSPKQLGLHHMSPKQHGLHHMSPKQHSLHHMSPKQHSLHHMSPKQPGTALAPYVPCCCCRLLLLLLLLARCAAAPVSPQENICVTERGGPTERSLPHADLIAGTGMQASHWKPCHAPPHHPIGGLAVGPTHCCACPSHTHSAGTQDCSLWWSTPRRRWA